MGIIQFKNGALQFKTGSLKFRAPKDLLWEYLWTVVGEASQNPTTKVLSLRSSGDATQLSTLTSSVYYGGAGFLKFKVQYNGTSYSVNRLSIDGVKWSRTSQDSVGYETYLVDVSSLNNSYLTEWTSYSPAGAVTASLDVYEATLHEGMALYSDGKDAMEALWTMSGATVLNANNMQIAVNDMVSLSSITKTVGVDISLYKTLGVELSTTYTADSNLEIKIGTTVLQTFNTTTSKTLYEYDISGLTGTQTIGFYMWSSGAGMSSNIYNVYLIKK